MTFGMIGEGFSCVSGKTYRSGLESSTFPPFWGAASAIRLWWVFARFGVKSPLARFAERELFPVLGNTQGDTAPWQVRSDRQGSFSALENTLCRQAQRHLPVPQERPQSHLIALECRPCRSLEIRIQQPGVAGPAHQPGLGYAVLIPAVPMIEFRPFPPSRVTADRFGLAAWTETVAPRPRRPDVDLLSLP
jgi:hypothetical protein